MPGVMVNAGRDLALAGYIAASGVLDSGTLDLFLIGEDFTLTPAMVIGDLVAATISGMDPVVGLVITGPYENLSGDLVISPAPSFFESTDPDPDPFVSGAIFGWALRTQGGSPALRYVFKFDTPLVVSEPGIGLWVQNEIPYGS